jgi:hypothetical protein
MTTRERAAPMAKKPTAAGSTVKDKRRYLSQADVPSVSLEEALRVPRALVENYGGDPTTPLKVAKALDMTPSSGRFRTISGAAVAYGLTEGGPNAPEIALAPLGSRIVKPLEEGDDLEAKAEALQRPRVIKEFLDKYDGHSVPRADIAHNVLEDMGVPKAKADSVLSLILDGARAVGFCEDIKGKLYIDRASTRVAAQVGEDDRDLEDEHKDNHAEDAAKDGETSAENVGGDEAADERDSERRRRVFITHGKNKAFIDPIKKLLAFGELEPVVATEGQSVSKPVPDKVLDAMRSCGAAIIHVDAERRLIDERPRSTWSLIRTC